MRPTPGEPRPSTLHVIRGDGIAHIAVIGDLQATSGRQVRGCVGALVDRGTGRVIIDLRRSSRIDHHGLGALVESAKYAHDHGALFVVAGAGGQPRRVIERSGHAVALPAEPTDPRRYALNARLETSRAWLSASRARR